MTSGTLFEDIITAISYYFAAIYHLRSYGTIVPFLKLWTLIFLNTQQGIDKETEHILL